MTMRTCSHEGCEGKRYARSMCAQHYNKWLRTVENPPKKPNARKLVLEALPGTCRQIAEKTGLHLDSVQTKIKGMRGTEVYVKGWCWSGMAKTPIYAKDNKPDAPCLLQAMTRQEYWQRYRERHPERVRLSEENRRMVRKARNKPQTWFSALGAA